jgi:pantetheine-phosphate adenylyltransferase
MKICIGGTFDILHKGHKRLIDKALEVAEENGFLFIGVTIGKAIKSKKDVKSFKERKNTLVDYLSQKKIMSTIVIEPIKDPYGPSVEGDFDAIVVSPETIYTAEEINKKRERVNKKPLEIITIPFVLAEDRHPISSSRIKKGKIDANGRIKWR